MRTSRPLSRSIALLVLLTLGVAACGSDDSPESIPAATDPVGDTAPVDDAATPGTDGDPGAVIGIGNAGGAIVDPQPYPIDGIEILESYPEQLAVRFTAGHPNCTAATATAVASGDTVRVGLDVGITEDALATSCLAGEFEQSITIALDEGLDGREVRAADDGGSD